MTKPYSGYYDLVRKDILPLFPGKVDRVLEIGCGAGDTLHFIKTRGLCNRTYGVELHKDAAMQARDKVDVLYEGNIESLDMPIESASLDVILCLDVLEHLMDPWQTIHLLHGLLKPKGVIIASIPNVRHLSVIFPLIVRGEWNYSNMGILDKSHLRFFVRDTAIRLMECSGLHVDDIRTTGFEQNQAAKVINFLTLGICKDFFHYQYLLRAKRID